MILVDSKDHSPSLSQTNLQAHSPNLIFHSHYGEQRSQILSTLDLERFRAFVFYWLGSRQAIYVSNHNLSKIALHAAGEVDEVVDALYSDKEGEDPYMEMIDVWWLLFAWFLTNGWDLDKNVSSRVNGSVHQDHIHEDLQSMILNLGPSAKQREFEHILVRWLEMFAGLPQVPDINSLISETLMKNEFNYPIEAFPSAEYFAVNSLSEAQRELWYEHPRRCLRLIRDFHLFVLGEADRSKGMLESDWKPYLNHISAYLNTNIRGPELIAHADRQYELLIKQIFEDNREQLPIDFLGWKRSLLEYISFKKDLANEGKKNVVKGSNSEGDLVVVQNGSLQLRKVA